MNLFSISQLEKFSGIKAHTIRMWEQRYNALNPNRSEGNTRYYDNSQLRRLLNIVSLMDADHKVSDLCKMSDEKLFEILQTQLKGSAISNDTAEYYTSQLIAAGMTYDEHHFEKVFSSCVLRYGIKDSYVKVIYPMLVRVGLMWAANGISSVQEHFVTNIIKQKIFSSIDSLPPANVHSKKWLLFLPENEFHEIGLLFSNYLIRQAGCNVVYLGSNVPFAALENSVKEIAPTDVLFFLIQNSIPDAPQHYLDALKKIFKKAEIHLSGNEKLISKMKLGKGINWIRSAEELEMKLL